MNRIVYTFVLVTLFNVGVVRAQADRASDVDTNFNIEQKCDARFNTSGNCLSIKWEKHPTVTDYGVFTFTVTRPNGDFEPAFSTESMNVRSFLPSRGVGSTPIQVKKLDHTTYRATNVYFSVRGDWQLIFELKDGSKVLDTSTVPYHF